MGSGSSNPAGVRRAAVAGSWYPDDAVVLRAQLEAMLGASPAAGERATPRALVVPHAGLVYSGATAATGWGRVAADGVERVVLLAPSHRSPLRGAAVDPSTHYETPLGRVTVDTDAVRDLARHGFASDARPFAQEHALEMQMPFLQVRAPAARLVPVLVGEPRGAEFAPLAAALAPLLDARTLLVVSSDFTHYGANFGYVPFTERVAERIEAQDREAIEAILAHDAAGFAAVLERTGATICGRRPLGVLLALVPPTWRGRLCAYTTSGAITGDWSHSVSYASIAFDAVDAVAPLSRGERATLLAAARRALEASFGPPSSSAPAALEITPRLRAPAGVFVSLHRRRDDRLRGCIGALTPRAGLLDAVTENALAAASRDPRFEALRAEELAEMVIEISVLGPVVPVDDAREIVVGRDGLVVTRGLERGVLLPQVASEQGWSRERFLAETCLKAGLESDAWRSGAQVERFTAEVFSEDAQRGR